MFQRSVKMSDLSVFLPKLGRNLDSLSHGKDRLFVGLDHLFGCFSIKTPRLFGYLHCMCSCVKSPSGCLDHLFKCLHIHSNYLGSLFRCLDILPSVRLIWTVCLFFHLVLWASDIKSSCLDCVSPYINNLYVSSCMCT